MAKPLLSRNDLRARRPPPSCRVQGCSAGIQRALDLPILPGPAHPIISERSTAKGTASQVSLRLTPDQIYLLLQGMEGASYHHELDASPEEYRELSGYLNLLLEEHGEQGDTLEEILR